MKKKFTVFLVMLLVFSMMLTACSNTTSSNTTNGGNSESSSNSGSAADTSEKSYVIANVPKMIGITWWDRMDWGNKEFAKETGNEVYQVGSTTADAAEQVKVLEDVIAQGIDALNIIALSPEACEPVLKKAQDAGIVVIAHETAGMANIDYDLEAFDNEGYGAQMMDEFAKLCGEEGEYVVQVGSLTTATHMVWANAAIERQKEKYPNMTLVTDIIEGTTQEASYNKMKELMVAYPNLKGIIGFDAVNPPGIGLAVEEAGKAGEIIVCGGGLVSSAGEFMKSGSVQCIMFWDPGLAGKAMCSLAVKVLNGEEITDGVDLGVPGYENCRVDGNTVYGNAWEVCTVENMDDYPF